ncbi:MAG TPA: hypothetical protein VFO70_11455 [Chitinophagaceae bacterium]|nr:hypothetical protein [Chitinophagaceae bacterium]
MKRTSVVLLTLLNITVFGQDNPTELAKPIVAEGKRLYKSEITSWYGTDAFLENYKDRANIGGYFSYSDNGIMKCIFFSKADKPKVIGTISFDSTYNTKTAKTDLTEREFSSDEVDLYAIRKIALATINSDTLFRTYKNTNLNLIPLIYGGERKVYVLTGPQQNGVVIFGNDYLLNFDSNNNLISMKQLHKNIIPINYGGKEEEGKEIEGTMHSHLPETGDFITATDICTLMLYETFTKWKQHNVISKNYLNIWNCLTDQLVVIPMSTIDKINKDQKKRNRNKNK